MSPRPRRIEWGDSSQRPAGTASGQSAKQAGLSCMWSVLFVLWPETAMAQYDHDAAVTHRPLAANNPLTPRGSLPLAGQVKWGPVWDKSSLGPLQCVFTHPAASHFVYQNYKPA